jgi:hypothetical protein
MDGRVQLSVNRYLVKRWGVEHIDTITEPGPNAVLAGQTNENQVASILARVDISVHKHGSSNIAVVGHDDCAGNPADRPTQEDQLAQCVALLTARYPGVAVVAVWADLEGNVDEVSTW